MELPLFILAAILVQNLAALPFASIKECKQNLKIDLAANPKGDIFSPNFGKEYAPDLSCTYELKAPPGFKIKLTFVEMDISPSDFCGEDNLSIYGDSIANHIATYCGTDIPYPVYLAKNTMIVKFNTDYMGSGKGFHVKYESSPTLEACQPGFVVCKNNNCYDSKKKCDGVDDCGDGTDEEKCGFPVVTSEKCGEPAIKPNTIFGSPDRIVGGEAAVPHSWPWMVSLQTVSTEMAAHFCGGTLINSQWVLTAVHCFGSYAEPGYYRFHIGMHSKYNKAPGEQIRYPELIIGYPDAQKDKFKEANQDIALVKLNAPVNFTDTVQPPCLPYLGWDVRPGWRCYATGWGETRGTGHNDVLKQVEVTTIPETNCTHDVEKQVCVDHPDNFNSPCHGDSGGPLVCRLAGKWYLIGEASYVTGSNFMGGLCAMKNVRTVYHKIAHKADWINVIIDKYS